MGRLTFLFLVSVLGLAGCGSTYSPIYGGGGPTTMSGPMVLGTPSEANGGGAPTTRVAILLPLTGPRADLGSTLLQAAQLAIPGTGGPALDVLDTGGTPAGASTAANTAVAHGDGVIIGPLTSAETSAVGPIAQARSIPVLAFTNDSNLARPGLWPLGISPGQQVRRLVAAVEEQGHGRFAALLPDSEFGRVMSAALQDALRDEGEPATIQMHSQGMASITAAVREISGYANRRGPIDSQIKKLKEEGTAESRKEIAQLQKSAIPPPPFDALLLADTGDALQEIAAVLPYYDVDRSAVQILGPALWGDPASGASAVSGAWFAAPDTSVREGFVRDYQGRYGAMPPLLADLAYDAALMARYASSSTGAPAQLLTQPSGFIGSDGLVILGSDGRVRRGLAVFRVGRGGGVLVQPPPEPSAARGF